MREPDALVAGQTFMLIAGIAAAPIPGVVAVAPFSVPVAAFELTVSLLLDGFRVVDGSSPVRTMISAAHRHCRDGQTARNRRRRRPRRAHLHGPGRHLPPTLIPVQGSHGGTVRTIASDFAATGGPIPLRALDVLIDAFFDAGNDLVVPTLGVSQAPGLEVADAVTVPATPTVNHNATSSSRPSGSRSPTGSSKGDAATQEESWI